MRILVLHGALGLGVLFALQSSVALSAHAQAAPGAPAPASATPAAEASIASPEYKELVREGMLKYTRGLYSEARAYFLKAHELAPNARTLRGLALVSYDWHHYVEAIDYAERALGHPVQPLNPKMTEELEQLLQQAQGLVARLQPVTIPAAAKLSVDGQPVARRADGQVWLDPGAHNLTASAPGFATETRQLQLGESSQSRMAIELASRSAPKSAGVAEAQARPAQPSARSPLPWVVVGASAVVAAVGGVLIAIDQSAGPSGMTPGGAVLLGVGAVGIAAGLTWSFWPRPQPERAPAAQLRFGPSSLQLRGSF